jgi:hypothetical protein
MTDKWYREKTRLGDRRSNEDVVHVTYWCLAGPGHTYEWAEGKAR